MKKVYDLAVKTGSYQNRNGETKNRYQNVGSVMEGDNGQFIIMDRTFSPAGVPNPDNKSSIIISMFAPKEGNGTHNAPSESAHGQSFPADPDCAPSDPSDSIPF